MENKEAIEKPANNNKKPLNFNVLTVGYPVFSLAFTTKHRLFIGGGGGVNRSGVKNVISLYVLNQRTLEVAQAMEHILPQNEDSVMSMCLHPKSKFIICGKNGTNEEILNGENKSLKVYRLARTNSDVMSVCSSDSMDTYNHSSLSSSFNSLPVTDKNDYRLDYIRAARTSESKNVSEYQKITEFDHEGRHILTGTTDGTFTLFDTSLRTIFTKTYKNDITDAHFDTNDEKIVVTTTKDIYILDIMDGSLIHEINNKSLPVSETCNFRAAKFGCGTSEGVLYAIANNLNRNKSFVCKYSTKNWKLITCKQVHNKPITAFTISPNGKLLGYGSADLSLGIISSDKLKTLTRIKDAHGLPCTCIQFTRDSSIIVSGSADGTCRISRVEKKDSGSSSFVVFIVLGVFAVIIAALCSQYDQQIMTTVNRYSGVVLDYTDKHAPFVNKYAGKYIDKYLKRSNDEYYEDFPEDILENMENLERMEELENMENNEENIANMEELENMENNEEEVDNNENLGNMENNENDAANNEDMENNENDAANMENNDNDTANMENNDNDASNMENNENDAVNNEDMENNENDAANNEDMENNENDAANNEDMENNENVAANMENNENDADANMQNNENYAANVENNVNNDANVENNENHADNIENNVNDAANMENNENYAANVENNENYAANVENNENYAANVENNENYAANVENNENYAANVENNENYAANVENNENYAANMENNENYAANMENNEYYAANTENNINDATNMENNENYAANMENNEENVANMEELNTEY